MLSRLRRALALLSIPAALVGIFVFAQANLSTGIPLNPIQVQAAWEYDKVCSQMEPVPGGTLEDVKWFLYPADSHHDKQGDRILGEWIAPDTIRLDSLYADSSWVIAHELLHHLINGRHPAGYPHPWVPFAFPCQLTDWQHYGGIMQYTPFKRKQ